MMSHAHRKPVICPLGMLLAMALLIAPPRLSAAGPLTPEEANAHVGEIQTVCGKVANTCYSCFVKGKPTFINFGRPYPNHVFSIAIAGADRDKFEDDPEDLFEDKSVCVTGLIESYDDKPYIAVREKAQILLSE